MKPMFEENRTGVTLNLTKPFIAWTAVFVLLAVVFDSSALLWVAALPWLAGIAFVIGVLFFITLIAGTFYVTGKPLTYTNSKGEKRIIQRGK